MPEHRTTRTLATPVLARDSASRYIGVVKLLLDNLPAKLQSQRDTLAQCLEAMDRVMPLRAVYLFGSHARGESRPDSDVDLCIVADGAERPHRAHRPAQGARRLTLE